MSLFFKKKQNLPEEDHLPALPEFPALDDTPEDEGPQELPSYEPTIGEIKREVERSESDIPLRERRVMPKMAPVSAPMTPAFTEEKPLFIKVDHYKAALRAIDELKEKIVEAERILKIVEDIRTQEDERLASWKQDLQTLKDKLLTIDQNLFEV